ncbi:uncharacterized protein LOC111821398 isoform X1 [Trichechus manatus latirostris]|uniref:Uncharacterized protein LOC111821398 isoform X1 n=1 Tax=Trichechus manatus latirostris TaxID=127582 RepID=A0A2Y9RIU4_TRIMA|nr:uncharacterized protein LOC111821398 isoform X1 [Trichechus manatus latirostris]
MEDFTEGTPLDTGPRYFFDQLKPERKTWIKRKCEDHVSRWRNTSRAKYCHKKKIESKRLEVRLSTVSDEEEEFHSLGTLQSSNVLKFSMALQVSKKYQQKHILEEYKLISSKILSELGKMLQKYAECNMTLPVGIANLINYSWEELTEGAYNKKYTSKNLLLKQDKALQRDSKSMTVADLKGYTITSYSREECHKENHLVIAEKEHVALSKSLEKLSFVNQNHCFHESSLPLVIHFSLSSKTCLEDGWIFPYPYSKSETLKWKTVLSSAVKKLQVAIIQSKVIAMMFNQDGGLVLNKDGYVIREWVWSSKGKLDDPVEIWVNKFITVKISGRFAITLVYKWQPQSLTLSLAPVRHKPFPPCLPEARTQPKTIG